MRKLKNPVYFLFLLITLSFITILIFSFTKLPETPPITAGDHLLNFTDEIGFFGKMMVEMLPQDLAFTAFVPSDKAFSRDLGMKPNTTTSKKTDSSEDSSNTYAVVSRIMGFVVVPYRVEEGDLGRDETASYESLSGFTLKIWRKSGGNGGLVVNGVESVKMGLKRGKIVVHVMDGVIMDSDFAQAFESFNSQDEEDEDRL